jgi:hypothetical protein
VEPDAARQRYAFNAAIDARHTSLLLFGRSGLLRLVAALPGIIVFVVVALLIEATAA